MFFKLISLIIPLTLGFFLFSFSVQAQDVQSEQRLEAKIINVIEEKEISILDRTQLYQKLEMVVISGEKKGNNITVENGIIPVTNLIRYKTGDEVVVNVTQDPDGNEMFLITDFVRRNSLYWLLVIFVLLTILIGRIRGASSIIAMAVSFAVIFIFILPRILAGDNPVWIAILGSLFIIPVTFYLSHGLNRKTTVAIFGTVVALIITGLLASFFVEAAKLTGFVAEEASFLQVAKGGTVNIKGLLLAGIIISLLGVLDDVTVSQAAVVRQLKQANEKLKIGEIYKRAMDVGQDHIASMVNTLVLVYAGASLPLLLLFVNTPHPFSEVLNLEIVADEIIRTLVGSIGLILAVPITTLIAAFSEERR